MLNLCGWVLKDSCLDLATKGYKYAIISEVVSIVRLLILYALFLIFLNNQFSFRYNSLFGFTISRLFLSKLGFCVVF